MISGKRGLDRAHHPEQVDLDDLLVGVEVGRGKRRRWIIGDAGVGEDHVEPSEALECGVDCRCHLLGAGDVGGQRESTLGGKRSRDRVDALLGEVDQGDVRAARDERACSRRSDPAAGAGHEDGLGRDVVLGHGASWVVVLRIRRRV